MKVLLIQLWYILTSRYFLTLLLIVNVLGTIYGYVWYGNQLASTEPQFLLFVPDSPTASLFFSLAIIGWIIGKNFKLIEALALITLVKYGTWAVVMNLLTLSEDGSIGFYGWMLVASHFLMVVEGLIYIPKYRFALGHIAIASIWTLHDLMIDYVYGQMPTYRSLFQYIDHIGYFTFWLSIGCIIISYIVYSKRDYLHKL